MIKTKKLLLFLTMLFIVAVMPGYGFVNSQIISNKKDSEPLTAETDATQSQIYVNGKIEPNTDFLISNGNSKVAEGKSDGQGIFFATISKEMLVGSDLLKLQYNNQIIGHRLNYKQSLVAFDKEQLPNINQPLELSGDKDLVVDVTTALVFGDPTTAAKTVFKAILGGVLGKLFPATPTAAELAVMKLDQVIAILGDMQEQIGSGFNDMNQRFSDIFQSKIDDKKYERSEVSAALGGYFKFINNTLSSEQYVSFFKG